MRRKTFDVLATGGGLVLVVVLVIAGSLLMWGYSFANSNVHTQLAQQQIVFPAQAAFAHPAAGTEITPSMVTTVEPYAGQPLTTGPQAQVYANDFIAVHLSEMPYGGVYAKVSAAAMQAQAAAKADPGNTALAANAAKLSGLETTVFQGTTLRGLLLEAYGFWVFGQIARDAAIAAFALAGLMLLFVLFGVWHTRRTTDDEELLAPVATRELVNA